MYQSKNRSTQNRKGDSTPTSFSDSGLSSERLNLITNRIKKDVEGGLYHGLQLSLHDMVSSVYMKQSASQSVQSIDHVERMTYLKFYLFLKLSQT